MFKLVFTVFFFVLTSGLMLISSCSPAQLNSKQLENNGNFKMLKFCPEDITIEAREVLGLQDIAVPKIDELIQILDARELKYERKKYWTSQCFSKEDFNQDEKYIIYGGLSDDKSYTRNFIVSVKPNGSIRFIEKTFSYKPPKF